MIMLNFSNCMKHVCMHPCIHECMRVCTYVCMRGCVEVCVYVCMYVCMYVPMYVCMDGWMDGWMYVRTYVRMHLGYTWKNDVCMHACSHACSKYRLNTMLNLHTSRSSLNPVKTAGEKAYRKTTGCLPLLSVALLKMLPTRTQNPKPYTPKCLGLEDRLWVFWP